jgi:hypothetical protein
VPDLRVMAPNLVQPAGAKRGALWAALLVLLTAAITKPFADSAVFDDWSFAKTALDLAMTGQLRYNGWSEPIVGAQAYWGAAFIKLFGFSFETVRWSIPPLAAACGALIYTLHRRANLSPMLSWLGTLTVTLSPIFVPHAVSFMTEIPALFLFLTAIYGYVRAIESFERDRADARHRANWRWFAIASIAGFLAGTVRQPFWVLPIVAPLYFALRLQRTDRHWSIPASLVLSSAVALLVASLTVYWVNMQPGARPTQLVGGLSALWDLHLPARAIKVASDTALSLGSLTGPVLVCALLATIRRATGESRPRRFATAVAISTIALAAAKILLSGDNWLFPWLPHTFTVTSLMIGAVPMPPEAVPGTVTLPGSVWRAFSCVTIVLTSVAVSFVAANAVASRLSWTERWRAWQTQPSAFPLLLAFAAAYLPLLFFKSFVPGSSTVFARYLLPILPAATIGGLRAYQHAFGARRFPALGWLLLLPLAYYAVAQTHDYFGFLRARTKLTKVLESHGIPRTRILGGFEYDGWTQVTVAGRVAGSDGRTPMAPPLPFRTAYALSQFWSAVTPDYIVCAARHGDLLDTDLKPQRYVAWLPPKRRACYVQVRSPALTSIRALPLAQSPEPSR